MGDANDYVGKGLSGGTIVVRPQMSSPLVASENYHHPATPCFTARPTGTSSRRGAQGSGLPSATRARKW